MIGPGAALRLVVPEPEPLDLAPAPEIPVRVVYEDDDLLIVDKPAGLVVHPSPGHAAGTLVNALLARAGRRGFGGIAGVAAAGHRPSPRPRHERPPDGRQDRRRAGTR